MEQEEETGEASETSARLESEPHPQAQVQARSRLESEPREQQSQDFSETEIPGSQVSEGEELQPDRHAAGSQEDDYDMAHLAFGSENSTSPQATAQESSGAYADILDSNFYTDTSNPSIGFYGVSRHIHHLYRVLKAIEPSDSESKQRGSRKSNPAIQYEGILADLADEPNESNESLQRVVNVKITRDGWIVSVGKAHTGISGAFITKDLFSQYDLNLRGPGSDEQEEQEEEEEEDQGEAFRFALPLKPLLDCLKIMATSEVPVNDATGLEAGPDNDSDSDEDNTGLHQYGFEVQGGAQKKKKPRKTQLIYINEGIERILLVFESGHGTKTVCEFKTLEPEENEDLSDNGEAQRGFWFDPTRVTLKANFRGVMFGRALKSLIGIETNLLTIRGSNGRKKLELVSESSVGASSYTFPKDSADFENLKVYEVEPEEEDIRITESEEEPGFDEDDQDDTEDEEDLFVENVVRNERGERVVDTQEHDKQEARKRAQEARRQRWISERPERQRRRRLDKLAVIRQERARRAAEGGNKRKIIIEHTYYFSQVVNALTGINMGLKQNLRCDARGFMSIQSMYQLEPKNPASLKIYLDYRFSPYDRNSEL